MTWTHLIFQNVSKTFKHVGLTNLHFVKAERYSQRTGKCDVENKLHHYILNTEDSTGVLNSLCSSESPPEINEFLEYNELLDDVCGQRKW